MTNRKDDTGTTQEGTQDRAGATAGSAPKRATDNPHQGATKTSDPSASTTGHQLGTPIGEHSRKQDGSKGTPANGGDTRYQGHGQHREQGAGRNLTLPGKQADQDHEQSPAEEEGDDAADDRRTTAKAHDPSGQRDPGAAPAGDANDDEEGTDVQRTNAEIQGANDAGDPGAEQNNGLNKNSDR